MSIKQTIAKLLSRKAPAPVCADKVERPESIPLVSLGVLAHDHPYRVCLESIVGPAARLAVHYQRCVWGKGQAERYAVEWWVGGERYIVSGASQVEVALAVTDVIEAAGGSISGATYAAGHREIEGEA